MATRGAAGSELASAERWAEGEFARSRRADGGEGGRRRSLSSPTNQLDTSADNTTLQALDSSITRASTGADTPIPTICDTKARHGKVVFKMSRNYFGDSDESGSDFDEDTSGLPFPKPLSRSSFLAPDFDPATFLSSLTNRHQTLEDLRQELRDLSQTLNKELLDLVNENYQDFLSLGSALKGGEEKVEEVRVGLLGFQRDVAAIQAKVEARRKEVESLLQEKKKCRTQANIAKALLDIAERIEELEERLMIGDTAKQNGQPYEDTNPDLDTFESESDDSDDDFMDDSNGAAVISLKKLEHHIQKYVYIIAASDRIGNRHPFLVSQQPRLEKIKSTLLLDLNTALEQAKKAGDKRDERTLKVMRLYDLLGAESSAVSALKHLTI